MDAPSLKFPQVWNQHNQDGWMIALPVNYVGSVTHDNLQVLRNKQTKIEQR